MLLEIRDFSILSPANYHEIVVPSVNAAIIAISRDFTVTFSLLKIYNVTLKHFEI